MFMYINKCGHDQSAFRINVLCIGISRPDLLRTPHPADHSTVNSHSTVLNERAGGISCDHFSVT